MKLMDSLNELRIRVLVLRGTRSITAVAEEMGLHDMILRRFVQQRQGAYAKNGPTVRSLQKIEAWCDHEEARQHAAS